jgi:hypothetical protein
MTTLHEKLLQVLKEIGYIGSATVVVGMLWYAAGHYVRGANDFGYLSDIRDRLAGYPVVVAGEGLTTRSGAFGRGSYSIVVITSPACRFCLNSAQFNRRVISEGAKVGIPVGFAVPRVSRIRPYLSSLGIEKATLFDWENLSRRGQVTPTLALVGPDGRVRRTWIGQLSTGAEAEVFAAIRDPASVFPPTRILSSGERMVGSAEMQRLRTGRRVKLVGISDRRTFASEARPGETNIPLDELGVRAPFELRPEDLIVVDCTVETDMACERAIKVLARRGYRTVALDSSAAGSAEVSTVR